MNYSRLIKEIVFKEIITNLSNLRFAIGSLLIILTSVVAVLITSLNYQEELNDYHQSLKSQDEAIAKYAHLNRIWSFVNPIVPPSDFSPIVQLRRAANSDSMFEDNGISSLISTLDLILITGILLSLLAILFSYDSVSGEREDGTLKLVLSNHLPRPLLLTGKWIGGTLTIWAPYLIMLFVVAILLLMNPTIQWDESHWLSFLLIGVAGLIYLSLFYLVGMLCSILSRNSGTSILISLFIWVVFVLVIPNTSPFLAAQLLEVPSVFKIEKETRRITGIERDNIIRSNSKALIRQYDDRYNIHAEEILRLSQEDQKRLITQTPELDGIIRKLRSELDNIVTEANKHQDKIAESLSENLRLRSIQQTKLSTQIASLSPYASFLFITTNLTDNGLNKDGNENRQSEAYTNILSEYLQKKKEEAQKADATFNENSYIDLKDRPRFIYQPETISDRIKNTTSYWGILIIFNGVLLLVSFIAFNKYDIR